MQTGDNIVALLATKLLCCGLLVFAATGGLASVLAWLAEDSVSWIIARLLVAGIATLIWRRHSAPPSRRRPTGVSD